MAEDLAGCLESALSVTFDPFTTSRQHPRYSQFKQKTHKASQEERRRRTLDIQKQSVLLTNYFCNKNNPTIKKSTHSELFFH